MNTKNLNEVKNVSDFVESQVFKEIASNYIGKDRFKTIRFTRIFDDGSCFMAVTDLRIPDYIVSEKSHIVGYAPSELINTSRFKFILAPDGPYSKHLDHYRNNLNVGGVLNLVERKEGYCDVFSFLLENREDENYLNVFLNKGEEMDRFISHFRNNSSEIIKQLNKSRFKLPDEMRTNFKGTFGNTDKESDETLIDLSTRVLSCLSDNINSNSRVHLTKREKQCLRFLLIGMTAREIGSHLGIGHRTIEYHVVNIKNKIGCSTKSEIRKFFLPDHALNS